MVATHLQSSDGVDIPVERRFLVKSVFIRDMIDDLGDEKLSGPIVIPVASEKVLKEVVKWLQFHTDNPYSRKKSGHTDKWDEVFMNSNRGILKELIITANYLDISELLHIGCRTITSMIKGRSPPEIRAILEIQPSPVSETATVNFRDLPSELRRTCYEYLDMSVETLITFHKAVQGKEGDTKILAEFTEWTSHLLAIVSPIQDYLNRLVPGADVAMWHPRNDTLWRRVDAASQEDGDYVCQSAKFWRFTHYLESDFPPIGRIKVDDKACLLIRKYDDKRFLVLCKREDLVVFSRNWMMLFPITGLHIRPCGSILDLDGAMNLFKPVEPEICYISCNDSREYTLPGTLRTREILSLLNQVENQEWNGYPSKICLEYARDFIMSMLEWYDDERVRYCCGGRFEIPLSTADREELERLLAEINKMLEVMEEKRRRKMRRVKAMEREETRSAENECKMLSARTKRKEKRDKIKRMSMGLDPSPVHNEKPMKPRRARSAKPRTAQSAE